MRGTIPDKIRVQHIFECIEEIEQALVGMSFEQFEENHIIRIAVVKWLEIIGDAANHISDETKDSNDKIEWNKMIGLRNVVVHEYFGINYDTIWTTATISLKMLKQELQTINIE